MTDGEMQPPSGDSLDRLVTRLDITVDRSMLEAFAGWLRTEGIAGGGLGPGEAAQVWDRHVVDSLAFVWAFEGRTTGRLLDVGSGVGLPGIPLAVAFPRMEVTLLDRSGRRTDLAERAVRVLGLTNVTVRCADLASVSGRFDLVTMRAVYSPERAIGPVRRMLAPDGIGVVAVSRLHRPDEPWPPGVVSIEVPDDVLDSPVWLLTIRP